jgi:Chitinase A, N-terminal domain
MFGIARLQTSVKQKGTAIPVTACWRCSTRPELSWPRVLLVVTRPPASAPLLTAPASNSTGSYTISWTGIATATGYTLQEQLNAGTWNTVQSTSALSWNAASHGNGTYGYRVQACNVGGCGALSATSTTTVLLPPATPTSISVPATSSGSIAVSWPATATATSYTLQQSFNGGTWTTTYSGAATSTTVTEGTTGSYALRVQACNGGGCSGYVTSSAVAVTIPPASAPGLTVPASNSTGSYTVSWTGVGGATSYTLQEQVNGGGWTTVQATSATSWAAGGKANGTYGYHVQACNAGGCGPWSGVSSVVVALPPPVPAGLHTVVVNANKGQYTMAWSASTTATSYSLQQTLPNSTVNSPYTGTALTAQVTDTATLGQVTVQVRACNASGCSAWSTGVSFVLSSN